MHRARTLRRRDFDALAAELMRWQVQRGAGLRVVPGTPPVAVGVEVAPRLGVGPFSVRAPCRVVYVVEEADRRGFAYGTLPGHPESGEESFVLTRGPDGSVTLTITAFSRPATRLARLGGPVGHLVQDVITNRYLRALDAG